MKIKPSQLLQSSNKYITNYDCSMIAAEGPNIVGKLQMGDIGIPYETFFVSKMKLEPGEMDKPIMYGFLGTDITYLMIKVKYDSNISHSSCCNTSSICCDEKSYLEYYFEDDALTKRYISSFMILTGTEQHRIPQVYLHNPNDKVVEVEIMAANVGECTISPVLSPPNAFNGLFFNSIASDQMYDVFGNTGSTQLEILDISYQTQLVITYAEIDIIEQDGSDLIVTTTHDDKVKLSFLSNFNAYQANSRINWVMEHSSTRYLANPASGGTYPMIDSQPPLITYVPHSVNTLSLNPYITKGDIRDYFINTVYDYADSGNTIPRDGIIAKDNVDVNITRVGSLESLTQITQDGEYQIVFSIADIANNRTTDVKNLIVDTYGPEFTLFDVPNIINLEYPMNPFITGAELKDYYIDGVYDLVDGVISKGDVYISGLTSAVTFSGDTGMIDVVGDYPFKFYADDRVGNRGFSSDISLVVYELSAATINFYSQYSGSTISGQTLTGYTESQLITEMVSGVTDEFEPSLNINDMTISGITFPVVSGQTYTTIFEIVNFSQLTGSTIKTIIT